MTDSKILDIFYNKIIPEAKKGKIDCYFMINTAFNLVIDNIEITKSPELQSDLIIPTLKITNKALFDNLLIKYVRKALEFYDPTNFDFLNDLNKENIPNINQIKEEYLIKYIIIATLFSNASFKDFLFPISFLQSRIAMFNHKIINSENIIDLGLINSINAKLYIWEEKSPIKAETPFRIRSYLEFADGYQLYLPEIYAGSDGEKYYLYGIQKKVKDNSLEEGKYLKRIRKGFIAKINGAPEHYFIAVMLLISLCKDHEIEITSFLIERWNAKKIAIERKLKTSLSFKETEEELERLQYNITNKLIRYFTKLKDVTEGIKFNVIPFENDLNLNVRIDEKIISRSLAFNEIFNLINEYKTREKAIKRTLSKRF